MATKLAPSPKHAQFSHLKISGRIAPLSASRERKKLSVSAPISAKPKLKKHLSSTRVELREKKLVAKSSPGNSAPGPSVKKAENPQKRSTAPSKLDFSSISVEATVNVNAKGLDKSGLESKEPKKFKSASLSVPLSLCIPTGNTPRQNPFDSSATHEILAFLYLGGAASAMGREEMKKHDIQCVINISTELDNQFEDELQYKRIAVSDEAGVDIAKYFDESSVFIDEARKQGRNVLVHCLAGMSRSATLVIAYLMKCEKMTLFEAYWHVKERRFCINPNAGFRLKLIEYEKQLFGKTTIDAKESSWPSSKHSHLKKTESPKASKGVSN
jgi:protein-tyrosine phosphatase